MIFLEVGFFWFTVLNDSIIYVVFLSYNIWENDI